MYLFHYRWAIPIIAEIQRNHGVKFIFLHKKLGVSKTVLRTTLQELIAATYISKNIGYGHPLRPEYIINPKSKEIAQSCLKLYDQLSENAESNHLTLLKSKWNLPVLGILNENRCRFSELKEQLGKITSRSLTLTLKNLERMGYVERTVDMGYPPTTTYRISGRSKLFLSFLKVFT